MRHSGNLEGSQTAWKAASEALRQLVRHIDSLGGTPAALEALRLLRMKLFSAPRMVHKLSDCVLEYLNRGLSASQLN